MVTFGVLLAVSVIFSRVSDRAGVPVALIFLTIGMLAGSEGIGRIAFTDYHFAFRVGTIALALILFDGGLNTPISALRRYGAPAGLLATVGVLATAGIVGLAARLIGFSWPAALLLGAVVSSTDAASVFAVLRGSRIHLKRRVGLILEVESGLNDPLAVLLTIELTRGFTLGLDVLHWSFALKVIQQAVVGGLAGVAIGYGGRLLLNRVRLPVGGLYPVLTLGLAFLAFGIPTLLGGSGFLAVYLTGFVLGNGPLPYRLGLLRVHDAAAWLSQISVFLVFGLLVFPSELPAVAGTGLALALLLTLVARPLATALCLLPFRYPLADIGYIGWVGLRGAVPIILALFPVLAGAPGADRIFNIVFFIVVANALVPGGTLPWLTRRLRLESDDPPSPPAVLEIESLQPLRGELRSFYVDDALAVAGQPLRDLPFPSGAAATLIVRGQELIPPLPDVVLQPGDHVYVLSQPEDYPFIQLMFGRPEE
ncbi:MAG TPA: potassium/proton antiporter [Gemmatimonadaceae bacterium]|nr:potassium/proton antiporter [Gemmatimonadaceae bacterium]